MHLRDLVASFIYAHCKPNMFLVPFPGILMVFGVWIDILAKVKFANLNFFFVSEYRIISFIFSLFLFYFYFVF